MADFDKVILNGTTYTIPSGGGSTSLTAGSIGTGIQAGNNLLEIIQAPNRYNPVYVYIYFYNTYGNVIDHLCFKTSVSNQIVTWDSQEYTGTATIVSRSGNGLIYSLSSLPSGYNHYSIYYSFTYYDTVQSSGLEGGKNYFATHTITDQSTTVTSYLEKKSVATSPTVQMYGLKNDGTVTRSVQTFDEFGNMKEITEPVLKMSTDDFGNGSNQEIKFTKRFIDAQWVFDNYSNKLVFTDDNADTPQTFGNVSNPMFAIKVADKIDAEFGDLMYSISYTDGSGTSVSASLSVMLENMGSTRITCSGAIGGTFINESTVPGGSIIIRLNSGTYTNFTITPDITPMSYGIVDYLVFTEAGTNGAVGQEFDSWQSDVMKTLRGLDEKEDVTASGLVNLAARVTALETALGNINTLLAAI